MQLDSYWGICLVDYSCKRILIGAFELMDMNSDAPFREKSLELIRSYADRELQASDRYECLVYLCSGDAKFPTPAILNVILVIHSSHIIINAKQRSNLPNCCQK